VAFAGKSSARLSDSAASTLPMLAWLVLAAALMIADTRGHYGAAIRARATVVAEPFWWLVASPVRAFHSISEAVTLRSTLLDDNTRLRRENEALAARIDRLDAVAAENLRLRELLGGTRGFRLNVRLVGILDVDLDPYRQRIVLDAGSDDGVEVGQALVDAGGVLGQVIEVWPRRAVALLITDSDHAVPVQLARSGLRTVAYGTGRADYLLLPNVPQSADIRVGDELITSGIGGRFPAGFPVGTITSIRPDATRLFVIAQARPAARLDRGLEVLLVGQLPAVTDAGPPVTSRPPPKAPVVPQASANAAPAPSAGATPAQPATPAATPPAKPEPRR
jgi:rod shape-determining protein MreC